MVHEEKKSFGPNGLWSECGPQREKKRMDPIKVWPMEQKGEMGPIDRKENMGPRREKERMGQKIAD